MKACPACDAGPGTVGVTSGHLCSTCLHREKVVWPPEDRKIVQLIVVDEALFCLCADGTAWEHGFTDLDDTSTASRRRWFPLPKPGAP